MLAYKQITPTQNQRLKEVFFFSYIFFFTAYVLCGLRIFNLKKIAKQYKPKTLPQLKSKFSLILG